MTITIIIIFCLLLLIAYLFELSSSKTKIPSVILLLITGWIFRQLSVYFNISIPDFSSLLPVLGTLGLILIVLEGSLELEVNRSKMGLIRKSILGAFVPMIALALLLAYLFNYFGHFGFKSSLMNAIPFCIISSAIAIPSVRNLTVADKEFITYESSLSDILGVLLFNFIVLNEVIDGYSFGNLCLQILIMVAVSFMATILLAYLLNRIEHHIKFVPIILLVILIYAASKIYHLPGLIFILLFGLFIGNLDELKRFKWIDKLKPDELNKEVQKFKELIFEAAFVIRALFFLLFGFLIKTAEILNAETFIWALVIVLFSFIFRIIQLKISKLPLLPLLYVAPTGLITILLFLSIDSVHAISFVNKSLIIQVIILKAILMIIGLMLTNKNNRIKLPPFKKIN